MKTQPITRFNKIAIALLVSNVGILFTVKSYVIWSATSWTYYTIATNARLAQICGLGNIRAWLFVSTWIAIGIFSVPLVSHLAGKLKTRIASRLSLASGQGD